MQGSAKGLVQSYCWCVPVQGRCGIILVGGERQSSTQGQPLPPGPIPPLPPPTPGPVPAPAQCRESMPVAWLGVEVQSASLRWGGGGLLLATCARACCGAAKLPRDEGPGSETVEDAPNSPLHSDSRPKGRAGWGCVLKTKQESGALAMK